MRFVIGAILILHGVAHLVGFFVSWGITKFEDMSHKTTLLAGRIDVGNAGIRVVGVMWLIAALAFVGAGGGLIARLSWWEVITLYASVGSLLLSISGWPDSRIGVFFNIAILVYLALGRYLGWLPPF